jgi:type II secretory pathway component PulJ
MRLRLPRPRSPRRGVTLVEMLVTVTLLILMMMALVQIFGAATGAVSAARTLQELDGSLRQLDSIIRTDLQGITAKMTPPINPEHNLGYFEYGENQFADLQGEDSDDYVRFTAKAPEGQVFAGRVYLPPSSMGGMTAVPTPPNAYYSSQPITITSQYAEIIYFLRNGNLYRRVFLVAPEWQSRISSWPVAGSPGTTSTGFANTPFGTTSWIGMNDLSARPVNSGLTSSPYVLNTLGDLTNRENRAFYPRFCNDYYTYQPTNPTPWAAGPDGIPDEQDNDGVPDWYTTMYPGQFTTLANNSPYQLLNTSAYTARTPDPASFPDTMSFPYIYPGAYSVADDQQTPAKNLYGQIHGLPQDGLPPSAKFPAQLVPYGYFHPTGSIPGFLQPNTQAFTPTSTYMTKVTTTTVGGNTVPIVSRPNHNPLESGDSLNPPSGTQTWWGFPTWKETMSANFTDPIWNISNPSNKYVQAPGLSWANRASQYLPPMTGVASTLGNQPFNDGAGNLTAAFNFVTPPGVFEDDLLMTGVRSFDVKAYDDTVPGYVDLGYSGFVAGIGPPNPPYQLPPNAPTANQAIAQQLLLTFGHEGRIPPLSNDFRFDAQSPIWPIGDDNTGVIRLRRVFDTWSTDYTQAPASGIDSNPSSPTYGMPIGGTTNPAQRPLYVSYPPPYPIGLRGLQIQIRVVDPRSEHAKVLTIRQDFTDKL